MPREKCSLVLDVPYESECIPSQSKRNPNYLQGLRQEGFRVLDRGNGNADISRLQEKNDPDLNKMIFEMIDAGFLEKVNQG